LTRRDVLAGAVSAGALIPSRVLNQLAQWAPDPAIRNQILVDNPARLYQF